VYAIDVSNPSAPRIVDSMMTDAQIVNDVMTTEDGRWGVFSREGASTRANGIVIFDAMNGGARRAVPASVAIAAHPCKRSLEARSVGWRGEAFAQRISSRRRDSQLPSRRTEARPHRS
jgi:hypothetical protein